MSNNIEKDVTHKVHAEMVWSGYVQKQMSLVDSGIPELGRLEETDRIVRFYCKIKGFKDAIDILYPSNTNHD